jgi:hypothetical protein
MHAYIVHALCTHPGFRAPLRLFFCFDRVRRRGVARGSLIAQRFRWTSKENKEGGVAGRSSTPSVSNVAAPCGILVHDIIMYMQISIDASCRSKLKEPHEVCDKP